MLQKAYFIPSNSGNPILEYSPYLSMIPSEIYLPVARLYLKECVLNLIVETFNNTERGHGEVGDESVLENFTNF